MIIRRGRRSRNFTIVGNEILDDERLTEELGVLVYLLSRPDDWRVEMAQLQTRFGYGRDKMQRVMKRLRQFGYAELKSFNDPASGKWLGNGYVVYDEPQRAIGANPLPENQVDGDAEAPTQESDPTEDLKIRQPEKPAAGFSGAVIPRTESRPRTESPPKARAQARLAEGDDDRSRWRAFEAAWRFDDPTDRREPARRLFERLAEDDQDAAVAAVPRYLDQCRLRNRKLCHARTWLRERGWDAFTSASGSDPPSPQRVFIAAGSPQAAAWARHAIETTGRKLFMTEMNAPGGVRRIGRYEETEWPPQKCASIGAAAGEGRP